MSGQTQVKEVDGQFYGPEVGKVDKCGAEVELLDVHRCGRARGLEHGYAG